MYKEDFDLKEEQTNRLAAYEQLSNLEGFKKLTPWQQKVIKASLYIQDRAQRHTPTITSALEVPDFFYVSENNAKGASQEFVAQWYCHAAVAYLEGIYTYAKSAPYDIDFPIEFFTPLVGTEIKTPEDVYNLCKKADLPFVLQVFRESPTTQTDHEYFSLAQHSCVVLGMDKNHELIIWEKMFAGYPFRLIGIKDIIHAYPDSYWGIRELLKPDF